MCLLDLRIRALVRREKIGDHVWLEAGGLQRLAPHLNDREALKQSRLLQVLDPDTAIGMIRDLADTVQVTHYYS
jgi:hypothetical protein